MFGTWAAVRDLTSWVARASARWSDRQNLDHNRVVVAGCPGEVAVVGTVVLVKVDPKMPSVAWEPAQEGVQAQLHGLRVSHAPGVGVGV